MNKQSYSVFSPAGLFSDISASVVVALVALPLCLGIALASGAPMMSGLLAGILGGIVIGALSGSHISVSGPAAGLTAIVLAQIGKLGSFEAFLLAVLVGGVIQIALGLARAGALSAFFPSSVIKGLLAAIGVILILKQIPHLLGHDTDPEGEMSFIQPDHENTFSEIFAVLSGSIHPGAMAIGLLSVLLLVVWSRIKFLKASPIPAPLIVVLLGVFLQLWFQRVGGIWAVGPQHLVQLKLPPGPPAEQLWNSLQFADFSRWRDPAIYAAGLTIAIVASLETLLNLQAADKLDPLRRKSPPNRELLAQGVGNVIAGLVGALPMTSVVVRSSVNASTGAKTKRSTILHGVLLLLCVALIPTYLELIPLSALAAILLVTGFKLASPQLMRQMWSEGRYQFLPFLVTVLTIVFTDLLIGILVGLGVSLLFILNSSLRQPIRRIVETHIGGDVLHIELADQVSFLNRAALQKILDGVQRGSQVVIDASGSDYIDPDILSLVRDYKESIAPARGVTVSLRGFKKKYQLNDEIQFADYSSRELQDSVTPRQVLEILREGNQRFRSGQRLTRDLGRQIHATAAGQHPLAVVLGCIDSRVPSELVFDLGIGDMFSVRVAGNVIGTKSLGSVEYSVAVAGAKLVLVLGHTRCGAVTAAVELIGKGQRAEEATGSKNLGVIVDEIGCSVSASECRRALSLPAEEREQFVDTVARRNVLRIVEEVGRRSDIIRSAKEAGRILVVGALYDVKSGEIEFFEPSGEGRDRNPTPTHRFQGSAPASDRV